MSSTRLIALAVSLLAGITPLAVASIAAAHDPDGYDSIYRTQTYPMYNICEGSNSGMPNPGSDMICLNDNAAMSFWLAQGGMTTTEKNLVREVLTNEYDDTDLNPQEVSNVVWDEVGTGETDLIMDEVDLQADPPGPNLPEGYYGVAWCQDEYGLWRCDQSYVFLDDFLNGPSGGHTYFQAIACHEIGHTVGLTHPLLAYPAQSYFDSRFRCMNEQLIPGDLGYTGPGTNNKHQINDWH